MYERAEKESSKGYAGAVPTHPRKLSRFELLYQYVSGLKALCNIPSDFDRKTFLYRMRVVHAELDVDDVLNGKAIGSRDVPNNPDQYNEPNTYQGQNSLVPFDGSKAGIYARVSVE